MVLKPAFTTSWNNIHLFCAHGREAGSVVFVVFSFSSSFFGQHSWRSEFLYQLSCDCKTKLTTCGGQLFYFYVHKKKLKKSLKLSEHHMASDIELVCLLDSYDS